MKQECSHYQKGSYSHQNSSHDPKEKLDVSKGLKKSTNASVERINKHPKCKILLFKEVSKHHIAFLNSKFYQISYCRMDLASKTNKCLLLCINRKSTNEFHSFPTLTAVSTPNWIWKWRKSVWAVHAQNEYSRLNRRRKRIKDSVANMG